MNTSSIELLTDNQPTIFMVNDPTHRDQLSMWRLTDILSREGLEWGN